LIPSASPHAHTNLSPMRVRGGGGGLGLVATHWFERLPRYYLMSGSYERAGTIGFR